MLSPLPPDMSCGHVEMTEELASKLLEELIDPAMAEECLVASCVAEEVHPEPPPNAIPLIKRPASKQPMRRLAPAPRPGPMAPIRPAPSATHKEAPRPRSPLREQDRLLPMANIARLMANELPADAKISRDAKALMQEMVSELICFLTSEANDISLAQGLKAIGTDDILATFEKLDLSFFAPVMEAARKHLTSNTPTAESMKRRAANRVAAPTKAPVPDLAAAPDDVTRQHADGHVAATQECHRQHPAATHLQWESAQAQLALQAPAQRSAMLSQAISPQMMGLTASAQAMSFEPIQLPPPVCSTSCPVNVPCAPVWNGSDGRAPVMATAVAVSRPPPPMPADAIGPRYWGMPYTAMTQNCDASGETYAPTPANLQERRGMAKWNPPMFM